MSRATSEADQRQGWRFIDVTRALMRVWMPLTIFPLEFLAQAVLGQQVWLFPLHMLAVAQMAFEFGRRGAVVGVVLSVSLWLAATYAAGWQYDSEWFRYLNAAANGLVSAFAAASVLLLRRTMKLHREHVDGLRALLDACHGCGAVRGSDGEWVPMQQLGWYAASRVRVRECDRCAGSAAH